MPALSPRPDTWTLILCLWRYLTRVKAKVTQLASAGLTREELSPISHLPQF